MALFYIITFVFLFQTSFAGKNTVPVFMVDHDKVMRHVEVDPDPFARISSASFADIIKDSVKLSAGIIIFIENTLSSEDISLKDRYGSPYPNLRTGLKENKVKYFPAVVEPYKLLNQILHPQKFNVFYLRTRSKLQLVDNFKYIYIFFQDGFNETRSDILRRHDSIMREVIFVIRQLKPGPVIAFYTGKQNPVVVPKIQYVPLKPGAGSRDLGVFVVSSGALFRFSDMTFQTGKIYSFTVKGKSGCHLATLIPPSLFPRDFTYITSRRDAIIIVYLYGSKQVHLPPDGVFAATTVRRAIFNQLPMVAEETFTRRSMSTKMAYTDFELEFNFSFQDAGWLIDNVALLEAGEEVGRTEMGVGAPWNWSYVCGEPLIIVNTRDGSSVTISQYQIQPRVLSYRRDGLYQLANTEGEQVTPPSFGKSINCGPYFNSQILSGLLVTVFCLSILMYGIMTMFDCVSNGRYEDPQSKALVHEVMH